MKRALAALCAVLMLALPCASVFAQPIAPAHCRLCVQCDQMHTFNAQPCCDQQPIPAAPQQPQTLEAPAAVAHATLPPGTTASAAAPSAASLGAALNPSPQRTTILRV